MGFKGARLEASAVFVQSSILLLHLELASDPTSSHGDLIFKTDFPYPYFHWQKRGLISLRDSSQSFSFYLLLPQSGNSLGLLYVHIPHSLSIQSQSTNICWLPFWPGFVTLAARDWPTLLFLFLAVSLWRPANSNTKG